MVTVRKGVVVPLLRSQADAQKIVRAAKFPPQGIRGFGSPSVFIMPLPFQHRNVDADNDLQLQYGCVCKRLGKATSLN